MRILPRSAAQRIALVSLIAYSSAMLALGIAVFVATHAAVSRQIDARIEQDARELLSEYRDDGIRGVAEAVAQQQRQDPISLGSALYDPLGHRIAGSLNALTPRAGWQRMTFINLVEGPDRVRAKVTALRGGYRLVVAADLKSLETIDDTILTMFAAAFAVLLLLGVGGAASLASYLQKRLNNIASTANAITAGELSQRATIGAVGDEFDRAAASLNNMLDRNAVLITNLRQVSGDIAHDLRTPLSRLRNQLELVRSGELTNDKITQVDEAVAQTDAALSLFNAILRISEIEEGSLRRAFCVVDVSALVAELGETFAPLAEDMHRMLSISVGKDLAVIGDRELLAQAMINLIENAFRHTPEGTLIDLQAQAEENDVVLLVRDNGLGIPEGQHEYVQQRFVRLEQSRSTKGHGLGLSMVRAIAEIHGAQLTLHDAAPGLSAEIRLRCVPRA